MSRHQEETLKQMPSKGFLPNFKFGDVVKHYHEWKNIIVKISANYDSIAKKLLLPWFPLFKLAELLMSLRSTKIEFHISRQQLMLYLPFFLRQFRENSSSCRVVLCLLIIFPQQVQGLQFSWLLLCWWSLEKCLQVWRFDLKTKQMTTSISFSRLHREQWAKG